MPTFEIICLANSTKRSGSCIAGLKIDGSGWLRPVSNTEDGTLFPKDCILDDGSEPQLFDIIRIQCINPRPKHHQPENWVINPNTSWELVGTPTLEQLKQLLNPEVDKHSSSPQLLGSSDGKICYDDLQNSPAQSSLAMIKPYQLQWEITSYQDRRNFRAKLLLGRAAYNLPITDPIWKSKLERLEEGIYSGGEVIEELELENFEPDKFLLTISLGEPFLPQGQARQFCYKLVAAVINSSEVKKCLTLS
jgi:hypothetical protein